MKRRHESLIPLSHHHHHGLVMAQHLKKAGTVESRLSLEEVKDKLADFWLQSGQQHFREEEDYLLPVYAQYGPLDRAEIAEMLLEHVRIRSMVDQILQSETLLWQQMNALGQLLDDHIRKEERVIFPLIEETVPEDGLRRIGLLFTDLTSKSKK